jgi:hypothetical protein
MEDKKIIKKEYNKTIHLHGREEILDFLKMNIKIIKKN